MVKKLAETNIGIVLLIRLNCSGRPVPVATPQHFYNLKTHSMILLQNWNFLEYFLNFFAVGNHISMIIQNLPKYNGQMFNYEEIVA